MTASAQIIQQANDIKRHQDRPKLWTLQHVFQEIKLCPHQFDFNSTQERLRTGTYSFNSFKMEEKSKREDNQWLKQNYFIYFLLKLPGQNHSRLQKHNDTCWNSNVRQQKQDASNIKPGLRPKPDNPILIRLITTGVPA